jgi:hypothetical protein
MTRVHSTVLRLLVLVAIVVIAVVPAPRAPAARTSNLHAAMARLPVRFEANAGQYDDAVEFVTRRAGMTAFLTDDGTTLVLRDTKAPRRKPTRSRDVTTSVITMRLVGAQRTVPAGEDELITKSNYFLGNDPTLWRTGVANFGRVRVRGALPDVDMVWHGADDGLEYDLEVAAGVDASRVELDVDGARQLAVGADGALRIETPAGTLEQRPPRVVQAGRPLYARYHIVGAHRIGFDLEGYDDSRPVLIDPVLAYSTYLGGNGIDDGAAVAVDAAGDAYVVGNTESTDFPTANARQGSYAGGTPEGFVAKLDASGSALLYSTYLGGPTSRNGLATYAHGVAVDAAGNAYVVGETSEHNFPTVNAAQSAYVQGSLSAAFVAKLSASGSALVYSTFLGGNVRDEGYAIAVDSAGSAYVTGDTLSTTFPTVNPIQSSYRGMSSGAVNGDAFVTKLTPSGSAFMYSTYLGGTGSDAGTAIAVDSAGRAYVTGDTASTDFPTANALQSANRGGEDVFVARLAPSGSTLDYSTYLGGSSNDFATGIAVDPAGSAFVGGYTISTDFPTVHTLKEPGDAGIPSDSFVTKLTPTGSAIVYSTYLGGSNVDEASAIAVDAAGAVYLSGSTFSKDFPTVNPVQATLNATNGANVFITNLNPAGSTLVYSTYLGGNGDDRATGIAIDSAGGAYVTGSATAFDFPTKNAFQPVIGNASQCCLSDAFVAKISGLPPGPSDGNTAAGTGPADAETAGEASVPDAAGPLADANAEASPDGGHRSRVCDGRLRLRRHSRPTLRRAVDLRRARAHRRPGAPPRETAPSSHS